MDVSKYGIKKLQTKIFINNKWLDSSDGKTFGAYYPATGEKIIDVQQGGTAEVDQAVRAAKKAFESWSQTPGYERSKLLLKLADLIERDKDELARIETLNNGKPYQSHSLQKDLPLVIQCLRYYGGMCDKVEGKTYPMNGNFTSFTKHEPVGVVGQVIPWNFPLLMLAWKFGPALAAGCTIVLKPSHRTPLSALKVSELVLEAGFPPGVINIIPGPAEIGDYIARHQEIDKVAFTGSTDVGRKILEAAAQSNLKNVTLELGGKGPNIILPDADLQEAAETAHHGLFFNMGQACSAGSRVFVHESIYDKFLAISTKLANERVVGDPFQQGVMQGPQIDEKQFKRVLNYIKSGKEEGARLLCGGDRFGDKGYFIQPTIFADVTDDMKIAKEEIFGPVMAILKYRDIDEVIQRANDTRYGLTAGVSTKDLNKALEIANKVRAGTIFINCWHTFDAASPWGGYKESGIGRELGEYGIRNYYEVKAVQIKL